MAERIIITAQDAVLLSHALRETSGIRNELWWHRDQDHLIRPLLSRRPPELGVDPQAIWQEPSDDSMEEGGTESNCGDDEDADRDDDEECADDDNDREEDMDEDYDEAEDDDDPDFVMRDTPSSSTKASRASNSFPGVDPYERRAILVERYKEAAVGGESDPFDIFCLPCGRHFNLSRLSQRDNRRRWSEWDWTRHVGRISHVREKETWERAGCPGMKTE